MNRRAETSVPIARLSAVTESVRVLCREQVVVAILEVPRLRRHRVWRDVDPDQGRGLGVLLVPGFGFSDASLVLTATWLRERGYRPAGARIGLNIGCTSDLVKRIERRLEEHAEATGGRVVLFGQSRGGGLARLVAVRRPDLVRGLITLASPVLDPLGAHPKVLRIARFMARLSQVGLPGLLTEDCLTGSCFDRSKKDLVAALQVPAVAVYSPEDAIAPGHLCQDPYAECVEVRTTHTGMALSPDLYTELAPRLAAWAAEEESSEVLARRAS
ncbi:esterase/lipase family protein [Amycolatopsis sp. NPDC052450]|uniref:esterase/lipase family protein n=1 Tax=Amycolatopsis sp. NPDC052450 TaxID=3363937 RepID=UPI0037CC138E